MMPRLVCQAVGCTHERPLWLDYMVARDEATRGTADGEGRLADFQPDAPRIRALQALRAERDG